MNNMEFDKHTANKIVDALYNAFRNIQQTQPANYNNTIPESLANMLLLYPDKRGHRSDLVKLPNHPTHPSRGKFVGNEFRFTDKGMNDVNLTLFGLVDNGDVDVIPTYNGAYVLPEITVTPNGNYYMNTYNNIKITY